MWLLISVTQLSCFVCVCVLGVVVAVVNGGGGGGGGGLGIEMLGAFELHVT